MFARLVWMQLTCVLTALLSAPNDFLEIVYLFVSRKKMLLENRYLFSECIKILYMYDYGLLYREFYIILWISAVQIIFHFNDKLSMATFLFLRWNNVYLLSIVCQLDRNAVFFLSLIATYYQIMEIRTKAASSKWAGEITAGQIWFNLNRWFLKGFLHRKLTFDMLLSIKKNEKRV